MLKQLSAAPPLVAIEPIPQGSPGDTVSTEHFAVEVEETELPTSWNDWQITPLVGGDLVVENLTPERIDTSDFPRVARIVAGIGRVRVSNGRSGQTVNLDCRDYASGQTREATGFVAGSLAAFAKEILDPLLDGQLALYGNANRTAFNAGCWAAGFDWSGVSIGNSRYGIAGIGVPITNRHLWSTWHNSWRTGDTVWFLTSEGEVIARTILAVNDGTETDLFNGNTLVADIKVGVLNEALPETVAVYPLVGDWVIQQGAETSPDVYAVGCHHLGLRLHTNRDVTVAVGASIRDTGLQKHTGSYDGHAITDEWRMTIIDDVYNATTFPLPDFLSDYAPFYRAPVGGDSSSPVFQVLGAASLAIHSLHSSYGAGYFPSEAAMNACIASADGNAGISTGLTVTVAPDPTA